MIGELHRYRWLLFVALVCPLIGTMAGCTGARPWYNRDYDHHLLEPSTLPLPTSAGTFTLFLVGDCGKSDPAGPSGNFKHLSQQLAEAGPNSAILYLGDNIYEYGLTADSAPDRKEMERRMTAQLDVAAGFKGKIFVIPGNHDWAQGKPYGLAARLREEAFVEQYLHNGNTYLPDNGCAGPVEVALNEQITLLAFDSQWWLHKYEKPGTAEGCAAQTDADFIAQFKAALERNKGKQIVVAAHHPLHSYGAHGGHYHPAMHLFPGLMFNKYLWLPLPVIGSAAVWYRKYHGSIQDIPHKRYQAMKTQLEALFADYPGLIYVSGHDHNLQYLPIDWRHYIVSGSGSKSNYVGHGKQAMYTDADQGFGRLIFAEGGKRRIEFFATHKGVNYARFLQEF